ncbi:S-formylglutathione hydrolase [Pseudohaliea rubra]|uniref:S-formylglutathione hydrolase n=1 Tax=Pseudohaliea rubra TaxID=475795 RepID=UPI002ADE6E70|nr:S-formylglutathione hydrolase [Pseudohaliea rubra]
METLAASRCFDGEQLRLRHAATTVDCTMTFSVFLPPQARQGPVPVLYWLSGLTCTDENFVTKAGAQRYAAEAGIALVAADTSPRGDAVPDDPEGAWDFGLGAGFYVNATEAPWRDHYRMYDYVVHELPALVTAEFPLRDGQAAIAGHSMGGHGALVAGLRNPDRYASISAFAPISAPSQCPWGRKALGHYLGPDPTRWRAWDAEALLRDGASARPLLVDQGGADGFLEEQLMPERLAAACADAGVEATLRQQPGYDHSYYFIASFIGEHIAFHAERLGAA